MKTLYYRRHSIKDGAVEDTIGAQGLALARSEGEAQEWQINRIFHGPLVRTAQTALAFSVGYIPSLPTLPLPQVMPVVLEIGTEELFREMATEQFRAAVKAGQSNFQALFVAHPVEKIEKWADKALTGVNSIFDQMENGRGNEVAIAFGHSPVIELAAWDLGNFQDLPQDYQRLGDLEGLIFVWHDESTCDIEVTEKISVQTNATA